MLMLTEHPGNNLENSLPLFPFLEINPYRIASFFINITSATFFSNLFIQTVAFLFLSFFFFGHTAQLAGSLFPDQGLTSILDSESVEP